LLLLVVAVGACATPETTPSASLTTYGQAAQVQLLAQALDASGNVVDQKINYTLSTVPGFGRSYFDIGRLATADHYQVTVWTAYFLQGRRLGP